MVDDGVRKRDLAGRAVVILGLLCRHGFVLAVRLLRPGRRSVTRTELVFEAVARAIEDIGPTSVKVGQMLSTRVDVLSPVACQALSRLYDRVRVPAGDSRRAVPALIVGETQDGLEGVRLVAAGSIAYVYRAQLRDGRWVAVKVRRPGIERLMQLDLALLRVAARHAGRLRRFRGAPLQEVAGQLATAIAEQLDFEQEARALILLRTNLTEMPEVRVPAVVTHLSGPCVLVTEWIDGLRHDCAATTERQRAVLGALRAAYRMLFRDGLVHCDMHPGNLYLMPDGTTVIVDAGFTRQLSELTRRRFAEFFYYLARNDGSRCADVLLSTTLSSGPAADSDGFRADVVALIGRSSGVAAVEFDLVSFAVALFDIQRIHGFHADPQFVFPILALVVLEGTIRAVAPDVDFQSVAMPYVLRGLNDTAAVTDPAVAARPMP